MQLKVKDRIALGLLAGLVGGTPARLINMWGYKRKYINFHWGDLAAFLFYPGGPPKSEQGRWVGRITNQFILALSGVAITYTLSATGRDKALLKGAGIMGLEWLGLYGLTQRVGMVRLQKPLTDLIVLADHVLSGAIIGGLVAKLGDDSLFPDAERQLPLVGSAAAPR